MPNLPDKHADVHLTLCLTHDCNLRCGYCYAGAKTRRHMTMATARQALELALGRVAERLHLVFFGGEPMLRWRSIVAITAETKARAASVGVEVRPTITTNGTLLTSPRAAWLAQQGFVVAISCDGVRAAHDAHRVDGRGHSSHGRTTRGIRRVLEAGLQPRCVLVVDPANVALLDESIEHLRGLGATDFVINPNWSADWSAGSSRDAWATAYAKVAARYVDAYRSGRPFWVSTIDAKIAAHIKGGYAASDRCDLGRKNLVVAVSGNLYPCDRLVGEDTSDRFVIGHVDTGPDLSRVKSMTGKVELVPSDCLGCAVAGRCRNRCVCANVAMTGAVDTPSEVLCFHEQIAIRAADEAAGELIDEGNALFVRRHYGTALDSA